MSIIYEALKKVEKSQAAVASIIVDDTTPNAKAKTNPLLCGIFYTFIAVVGFFLANFVFELIAKPPALSSRAKPQQTAAKLEASSNLPASPLQQAPLTNVQRTAVTIKKDLLGELVLNGLFFSEDKGYCLINNQILKEGDEIDGAIVKRITLDGAELETKNSIIQLSNNK